MSLAAVPVFLIVRRLRGGTAFALAAAAIAVAAPSLTYSSYVTADAVGYPLALGAIAAIVAAVDRPSKRLQIAVLGLSGLATFARVQYVVLPAVFLVAAFAAERWSIRRVVSRYRADARRRSPCRSSARSPSARRTCSATTRNVIHLHVSVVQIDHWYAVDLMLLVLASGVVLVPAALSGLVAALVPSARPRRSRHSPARPSRSGSSSSSRPRSTRRTAAPASRSAT